VRAVVFILALVGTATPRGGSGASLPASLEPGPSVAAHQANNEESIDDPKLTRRLGTRIAYGPMTPPPGPNAPLGENAEPMPALTEPGGTGAPFHPASLPRLKLGFRRFDFIQIGAAGASSGTVASEAFDSISIDVYPLSNIVRIGLSTQFAWQEGHFAMGGDYFAAQSVSAGVQYPFGRVVPFAEGFTGVGYMRRLQFERTVPTVYWHFGIDVGTELYFARIGYVSAALGWLHAVNGFAEVQTFRSVFLDTWSFKLGVGI
jgi:hypothetical protein